MTIEHAPLRGPLVAPSGGAVVPESIDAAVAIIRDQLARDGISHFRGVSTREQFLAIAKGIGVAWAELFVFSDPSKQMFVRNPRPVRFHTDSSKANVIGWYCVEPCPSRAPNLYLDGWDAYAKLDDEERRLVGRVCCPDPLLMRNLKARGPLVPVVQPSERGPLLFWLPDRLEGVEPECQAAIAKFGNLLAGLHKPRIVRVRLAKGNFVFVDNNRFLHGRAAIPPDSPRMLYRLWINTDGWPGALTSQVEIPARVEDARLLDEIY